MNADLKAIMQCLIDTHTLDRVPRAGYLIRGVTEPESVAAHTHAVSLLTMQVCDLYPDRFDKAKALSIAIIHDLPEAVTMDIPMPAGSAAFKAAKRGTELELAQTLLPSGFGSYQSLYEELLEAAGPEAKLVRGLDKVQMMIKVLCYEKEGRGRLEEFWLNSANFEDYGLPVIRELFEAVFELAGRTQA